MMIEAGDVIEYMNWDTGEVETTTVIMLMKDGVIVFTAPGLMSEISCEDILSVKTTRGVH